MTQQIDFYEEIEEEIEEELLEIPGSGDGDLPEEVAILFGDRLPLARISETPPRMVLALTILRMQCRAATPGRKEPLAKTFERDFLELMIGVDRKGRDEAVQIFAAKRAREEEADTLDLFAS